MLNFKKDRLLLLKELRDLVTEGMDNFTLNSRLNKQVIEDKRRNRKLKLIRRELDDFIEEVNETRKKIQ